MYLYKLLKLALIFSSSWSAPVKMAVHYLTFFYKKIMIKFCWNSEGV